MDAGKIAGNVINAAIGTEYTGKSAHTKPDRSTENWDKQYTLQISKEGYRKWKEIQQTAAAGSDKNDAAAKPDKNDAVAKSVSSAKQNALKNAMTDLTNSIDTGKPVISTAPDITSYADVEAALTMGDPIDVIYDKALQSIADVRMQNQMLREGMSELYRSVMQDTSLSPKDKADAINEFMTRGRQVLSRIEDSLGYSLARLHSIRNRKQASPIS